MEALQFIFSGFWIWLGAMILLALPLKFIHNIWVALLKYLAIRKSGYPPLHCDANGNFLTTENED
jgi:hypothetical protein